MLNIEHLTKTYGDKKAVDGLNLYIRPGEIYGFIGHNGAGKSTTLKSVAGILQFDKGEIYIDGTSIKAKPLECKRKFAYIPDNPDLFELTADLAQPIAAYSHGMKQKLAIISAWLHEPKLILMDEPFVGLDPKASHLLKEMMRQVCDQGGAIFFSTHVLEVAKDNDLMLSLPIPFSVLMASRLTTVYLMGLMYSSVVIVPLLLCAALYLWLKKRGSKLFVVL